MIKVKNNQCLFDVAIEHFGAFDAVVELAFANDISITDSLEAAAELSEVDILEEKTAKLFGNLFNKPATALSAEDEDLLADDGHGPFDDTFDDTFDN